jgi:hypothetical protein
MYDEVTFQRDARAILVPDGIETTVTEGTQGFITQVLGGNFTVQLMNGYLARVDAKDADALGREVPPPPEPVIDETGNIIVELDRVWEQLRTCYDPEIPVNIVELGLIYGCELEPVEGDQGGYKVDIQMTLTLRGCSHALPSPRWLTCFQGLPLVGCMASHAPSSRKPLKTRRWRDARSEHGNTL